VGEIGGNGGVLWGGGFGEGIFLSGIGVGKCWERERVCVWGV